MKLLVATDNPNLRTIPGEIIIATPTCSRSHDGRACGCERSFSGLGSGHFTTDGIIADVPVTLDELVDLVRDHGLRTGTADDTDESAEIVADLVAIGDEWPIGTVVTRNHDLLIANP